MLFRLGIFLVFFISLLTLQLYGCKIVSRRDGMDNKNSFLKVAGAIETLKKEKNMTNSDIAKKLNVSNQAVSKKIRKLSKGENCGLNSVVAIFKALDNDFFSHNF